MNQGEKTMWTLLNPPPPKKKLNGMLVVKISETKLDDFYP